MPEFGRERQGVLVEALNRGEISIAKFIALCRKEFIAVFGGGSVHGSVHGSGSVHNSMVKSGSGMGSGHQSLHNRSTADAQGGMGSGNINNSFAAAAQRRDSFAFARGDERF